MPRRVIRVRRKEGRRPLEVGYHRASGAVNRLFVIVFSSVLLVCALPIMLLTALVVLLLDGRPLFYSGVRLGKNKVPFRMYKFRTLVTDAQQRIGPELFTSRLSSNRELLTRSGQFLRDTRLDEIPQIFNVLKGDMDILGPRPERPEIYEKYCRQIKGYDRRFAVKPGLIGYSQIFTPHSAPKRMRYLVDNKFLIYRHRYSIELVLVLAATALLFVRVLQKLFVAVRDTLNNLVHRRREKRILVRHQPRGAVVRLTPAASGEGGAVEGVLKDINEEALLALTPAAVGSGPLSIRITATARNWHGVVVRKTAFCTGEVMSRGFSGDERLPFRCVVRYRPATPRNAYIVHQYLLESSILSSRQAGG